MKYVLVIGTGDQPLDLTFHVIFKMTQSMVLAHIGQKLFKFLTFALFILHRLIKTDASFGKTSIFVKISDDHSEKCIAWCLCKSLLIKKIKSVLREKGWIDPRALSCWYFVKHDPRHSGRTGITSIVVRGLALVPKDQTFMK